MKSPYERTGAKGSWQSIANWWYCSDCREMKNLPEHQISDDTNDYLSKDAADKFPTIARSRREFNAQYVDMLKLKEAVNEYQHKSKLPSLTTRNLMTGWLNEPAWICSHCGEFEFVAIDTFAYTIEEEMISEMAPVRHGSQMKLGMIPYYKREVEYDRMWVDIITAVDQDRIETAGDLFLVYCLQIFNEQYVSRLIRDFIVLSRDYSKISSSRGYQFVHILLSFFAKTHHKFKYGWISCQGINAIKINNLTPEDLLTIEKRFHDFKLLVINYYCLEKDDSKFELLSALWGIEALITHLRQGGSIRDKTNLEEFKPFAAVKI